MQMLANWLDQRYTLDSLPNIENMMDSLKEIVFLFEKIEIK